MQLMVLILLVIIWLVGVYLFILKSHQFSSFYSYSSITLQLVAIVGIITVWKLNYFIPDAAVNEHGIYRYIHEYVSEHISKTILGFIGLVYVILLFYAQHLFKQNILKKDGVSALAKVISITRKDKKSPDQITIEYVADEKKYQQLILKNEHNYSVGDELEIIYSKKEPEMFELKMFV